MRRTHDAAFLDCPICGKAPYVRTHDVTVAWAYCKGYGFHKHKNVQAFVAYERPSNLLKKLSQQWNQMWYEQARFLFHTNGDPFKNEEE